jgi:hypothetical protein
VLRVFVALVAAMMWHRERGAGGEPRRPTSGPRRPLTRLVAALGFAGRPAARPGRSPRRPPAAA